MSAAVKICGIRDAGTLAAVAELPVEYAGFVFAQSRRQVSADEAAAMMEPWLAKQDGRRPMFVGVFVDPAMEELERILRRAPLDVVQLHGKETPAYCREVRERFGVKVWKVFSVTNPTSGSAADAREGGGTSRRSTAGAASHGAATAASPRAGAADNSSWDGSAVVSAQTGAFGATAHAHAAGSASHERRAHERPDEEASYEREVSDRLLPYCGAIDGIMLDHGKGGTGIAFAWDLLPPYRAFASSHGLPLIVAGGLDADNVGILLDAHRPDVVDVSSGVETNGIKDKDKIRAFVGKVKSVGRIS